MPLLSSKTKSQAKSVIPLASDSRWRGVLIGLVPLLLLVGISAFTLIAGEFVRQFLLHEVDFFTQQRVSVIILATGLGLAVLAYAVAIVLIMRRIGVWQQGSAPAQARAALWTFICTALLVITPLLLAIVLPQHPAP